MSGKQWRTSVDVSALKRGQLLYAFRVFVQHPRHIHKLGEANDFRMITVRDKVGSREPRTGSLQLCCGYAGRKLYAKIHRGSLRGIEKILQPRQPQHIADLVRIANGRRNSVRKHAAVELSGGNQRALAMHVAIDKSRRG